MAAKKAKATNKGKRYTDAEKSEILGFIENHGRGGATAASKKFGVSPLTLTAWKKAAGGAKSSATPGLEAEVIRTLAGKGYKFVRLINSLTGEVLEEKNDPKIEKLGLSYGSAPAKLNNSVHVTKNGRGQLLVTLTLERLLELTGTKP